MNFFSLKATIRLSTAGLARSVWCTLALITVVETYLEADKTDLTQQGWAQLDVTSITYTTSTSTSVSSTTTTDLTTTAMTTGTRTAPTLPYTVQLTTTATMGAMNRGVPIPNVQYIITAGQARKPRAGKAVAAADSAGQIDDSSFCSAHTAPCVR